MPSTKPAAQQRRKDAVEYEADTPRCSNCFNFGRNNVTTPICRKNKFAISPQGLCNDWLGKDGATLEGIKQ